MYVLVWWCANSAIVIYFRLPISFSRCCACLWLGQGICQKLSVKRTRGPRMILYVYFWKSIDSYYLHKMFMKSIDSYDIRIIVIRGTHRLTFLFISANVPLAQANTPRPNHSFLLLVSAPSLLCARSYSEFVMQFGYYIIDREESIPFPVR